MLKDFQPLVNILAKYKTALTLLFEECNSVSESARDIEMIIDDSKFFDSTSFASDPKSHDLLYLVSHHIVPNSLSYIFTRLLRTTVQRCALFLSFFTDLARDVTDVTWNAHCKQWDIWRKQHNISKKLGNWHSHDKKKTNVTDYIVHVFLLHHLCHDFLVWLLIPWHGSSGPLVTRVRSRRIFLTIFSMIFFSIFVTIFIN